MTWVNKNICKLHLKLIESELTSYPETIKKLRELEEEIASPSGVQDSVVSVRKEGHGDPTFSKAFRMMTSLELLEMRKRIEAIQYMERILQLSSDPARYKMIELAYWSKDKHSVVSICQKLHISQSTYFVWRKQALALVAERLGWVIEPV